MSNVHSLFWRILILYTSEVNSGMRMPNVTNSTIDALAGDWTPEVTVNSLV